MMMRWKLVLLMLPCALMGAFASASTFTPPNNATQLAAATTQLNNHPVLLGAAEKVGRELRFDQSLNVTGESTHTIWKLAAGAQLGRSFDAASAQLQGEVLFSCAGRDCGRSTAWANLVFNNALLYSQDRYQRYRVVRTSPTQVQLLYAVQRGNRRIHLRLETIDTGAASDSVVETQEQTSTTDAQAGSVVTALDSAGGVRLNIVPGLAGELDQAALDALANTGVSLLGAKIAELYVVCHLYGAESASNLLAASNNCAAAAAEVLQKSHARALRVATSASSASAVPLSEARNLARLGITFIPFGAGPLLPRLPLLPLIPDASNAAAQAKPATNRIELIAPARL